MTSKAPPIPPEQRGSKPGAEREDHETEASRDPAKGNADLNLKEQGRYGNINQNTHNVGYQQDR